ncbi:uncharacterized protein K02A2.6-like [Ornithodoros turicata]|uniref:uncharacterized protein K02A2.6-like n=1 Tax=Ornithodoros turicata TaxID=34597 RepID=UPI003139FAD8
MKEIPDLTWERVASDLFSFEGQSYIVIVDNYSGYLDFRKLRGESAQEVVNVMKEWLATHGIPKVLETDNGPCYTAKEFKNFTKDWEFHHITSSPRYPQSNGLAERAVQTAKSVLRKCALDGSDIQMALLNLRNTPRNEGLGSPAQRLYSRRTKTTIPMHSKLLQPKVIQGVRHKLNTERDRQKRYGDQHTRQAPKMAVGQSVKVWEGHRHWIPGTVIRHLDEPRSVIVKTQKGLHRRNTSFVRPTKAEQQRTDTQTRSAEHCVPQQVTHSTFDDDTEDDRTLTRSGRSVKPVVRLNL